ncbi:MAG TPA: IclR family transcriptional regulator [Pseudonocardia sp.]|nr:IclR family transcriptional regulator [Pseudonocardia sp.]
MQSLSRALTLLLELSRRGRPLTLSELTDTVGLHKSTVYRMLTTFVDHGLVQRDEANRYLIGQGVLDLVDAARADPMRQARLAAMITALTRSIGQPSSYAVPHGAELVRTIDVDQHGCVLPSAGRPAPAPLHATALGKAYLAFRPRAESERYVAAGACTPYTDRTIVEGNTLQANLDRTRVRGYAIEDREYAPTVRRLAAPVVGADGLALAAVGVVIPGSVRDQAILRRLGAAVVACADRIGSVLSGYEPGAANHRDATALSTTIVRRRQAVTL